MTTITRSRVYRRRYTFGTVTAGISAQMLALILLALTLSPTDYDHLRVGDTVVLTVEFATNPTTIDFSQPLQWRNYDLMCKPEPPSQMRCLVVGKRDPA